MTLHKLRFSLAVHVATDVDIAPLSGDRAIRRLEDMAAVTLVADTGLRERLAHHGLRITGACLVADSRFLKPIQRKTNQ